MSENLTAFLRAWLAWVEAGAPESDAFERFAGLCSNFRWYMCGNGASESDREHAVFYLQDIFKSEGLDEDYPFGGPDVYYEEAYDDTSHLNEQRIAWVRSKVGQVAEA